MLPVTVMRLAIAMEGVVVVACGKEGCLIRCDQSVLKLPRSCLANEVRFPKLEVAKL
jgi:hypothetical protein